MFSKTLLTIFTLSSLLGVHCQSSSAALPTSTSSIPSCVLTCTGSAASQSGCSGVADLQCVCSSQTFQSAARSCLQSQCSPADQATANALQSALCANVSSSSGSGSASATSGSAPATSGSGSVTSGSATSATVPGASTSASGSGSASTGGGALSSILSSASSLTSSLGSGASSILSSASSVASSAANTPATSSSSSSNAASALSFGLDVAHVFGAIGVAVGMVVGAGALL